MYSFLKPKNDFREGRYFPTAPSLPLTEQGKPFRFSFAAANKTVEEIAENLEHGVSDVTITAVSEIRFSCDGYVVIDGELYKIQDGITVEYLRSSPMLKATRKRYTMRLRLVDNPIGLEV